MFTEKQLENYASIMVNYAVGNSKGIQPGETVLVIGNETSKPLYLKILQKIWEAGGNVIQEYYPTEAPRGNKSVSFFDSISSENQLDFAPKNMQSGLVKDVDHLLLIIANDDPTQLKDIEAGLVKRLSNSGDYFMKQRRDAEMAGELTWTLCLYPTQAYADEAGMSLQDYFDEVANACYLNDADPVNSWIAFKEENSAVKDYLDKLAIDKLHIEGEDADLWIKIGEHRKWLGASGRNIPSFEVFVSPDWRGTEGWIKFNQPLYYGGKKISGIELAFEKGKVITISAKENEDTLVQMIRGNENADQVGEFSLTDSRHSKIGKFMANTLFDENAGGRFGNTHVAVGASYRDSYSGDASKMTEADWENLGFNKCASVHTDIVSTADRKVTAYLKNGSDEVIYKDGKFTFI